MEHVNDTGQNPAVLYAHNGSTSVSEPINGQPASVANGSTIGFICESPEQLQEFHDVAVANGGTIVRGTAGTSKATWA